MSKIFSKSPEDLAKLSILLTNIFNLNEDPSFKNKLTQEQIGRIVGRTQSEVSHYFKKFKNNEPYFKDPEPREPTILQRTIQETIKKAHKENADIGIHETMSRLEASTALVHKEGKPVVSRSYVYQVAKEMDYSSKALSGVKDTSDANKNRRRSQASEVCITSLATAWPCYVIFADEMSLNTREAGENARAFSPIGVIARNDKVNRLKSTSKSVSAIIFLSQGGVEYIYAHEGTIDAETFDYALRECLYRVPSNHKVLLLLDNAKIHRKIDLRYVAEEHEGFSYAYLPVDSPDCNAVESVIHLVRSEIEHFITHSNEQNAKKLWEGVVRHLENFKPEQTICRKACEHALRVLAHLQSMPYPKAVQSAQQKPR